MWYCRSSASIAVLFGDLGDRGDLAPLLLFARGLPLAILTFLFEIESKIRSKKTIRLREAKEIAPDRARTDDLGINSPSL